MFGIGAPELVLILIVGLIVFGPGKLPEMGRTLGKGLREFRRASNALTTAINTPDPPPAPAQPAASSQNPSQTTAAPAQQTPEQSAPAAAPAAATSPTTETAAAAVEAHRAEQQGASAETPKQP